MRYCAKKVFPRIMGELNYGDTILNSCETSGFVMQFDYDLSGNMTVLTTPSEVEHDFLYDLVDRNIGYLAPLSGS